MGSKKSRQLNIRLSNRDKEKIEFMAKEYGYSSISEYIVKSSLGTLSKTNLLKINTLTLNPAIDYIINTKNKLQEITNFDTSEKEFEAGGKGINASIIVDQLGVKTTAIHYSGGFSGELIKQKLNEAGIQQVQVPSKEDTRINLKLNFGEENFEINSLATPLSSVARKNMLNQVSSFKEGEVLMIMGSYHPDDEEFIFQLSEMAISKKVELVYDISKPVLKDLIKFKPLIVKPNLEELEWIFGKKIKTEKEIIKHMQLLREMGAKNVAITMGKNGAYLLDEKNNLYKAKVDPIKLVSPQGSGDSFISTFVVLRDEGSESAFKWANAAGAATAQVSGLATYQLIENTLEKVHIKKI